MWRIVEVSIGGAVTIASRSVTCDSVSVVTRIASSTSRRTSDSDSPGRRAAPRAAGGRRSTGSRPRSAPGPRRCADAPAARAPRGWPARGGSSTGPTQTRRSAPLSPRANPASRYSSTTRCSTSSWRSVSIAADFSSVSRGLRPGSTGFSPTRISASAVADDPLAALLGLGRAIARAVLHLCDRAGDRDLLLEHPHAAELDRQALEPSGPRAASVWARATWAIVHSPCRIRPGSRPGGRTPRRCGSG